MAVNPVGKLGSRTYTGDYFGGIKNPYSGLEMQGRNYWSNFQPAGNYFGPQQEMLGNALKGMTPWGQPAGGSGSGTANSGYHIAQPTDPEVKSWMDYTSAGRQNQVDSALQQMAGVEISRNSRGLGVKSGINPAAQMALGASRDLASRWTGDFKDAMDYNKYFQAQAQQQQQQQMNQWRDLMALQTDMASRQMGYDQWLANQRGQEFERNWQTMSNAANFDQQTLQQNRQYQDQQRQAGLRDVNSQVYTRWALGGGDTGPSLPQSIRDANYLTGPMYGQGGPNRGHGPTW